MNEHELDELYRRTGVQDPARPGAAARQRILERGAQAAAEHAARTRRGWRSALRAWLARSRERGMWTVFAPLAAAAFAAVILVPIFRPAPIMPRTTTEAPSQGLSLHRQAPSMQTAPAVGAPASAPMSIAKNLTAPLSPPPPPSTVTNMPVVPVSPREQRLASPPAAEGEQAELAASSARQADVASGAAANVAPQAPAARGSAKVMAGRPAELHLLPESEGEALRRAAAAGDEPQLARLLQAGPALESRDPHGRTALMLAVLNGRTEAVQMLLAHGADPDAGDEDGRTPLALARARGNAAMISTLENAGAH